MAQTDCDTDQRPNRRPTSTIAMSFSAALDDAFFMSDTLDCLSEEISRKRQSITFQQTELEQLESKLRKMEVELQEKQSQLPFTCHDGSGSGHRSTQRRKGLEAILEPDARENGEEENTAKATSATRRPSAAADTRPLSSSSHSNDSIPRQVVQKRRKTVDSRTRNLPSRGRS